MKLHPVVKNHFNFLNERIHLVLTHINRFEPLDNYVDVVNNTFIFFENHVHELMETSAKKNIGVVSHMNNILDNVFFEDCVSRMCADVLRRFDTELLQSIFNLCITYQNFVSNQFRGIHHDDHSRINIFIAVCASIALFCKIKMHYPVPAFDHIKRGIVFDPQNHQSKNDTQTNKSSIVTMAFKPGLKDLYTGISFEKSEVFTQINNPSNSNIPIHNRNSMKKKSNKKQSIEQNKHKDQSTPLSKYKSNKSNLKTINNHSLMDEYQRMQPFYGKYTYNNYEFKYVKPPVKYVDDSINAILCGIDIVTNQSETLCRNIEKLVGSNESVKLMKTDLLKGITSQFVSIIKELQIHLNDYMSNSKYFPINLITGGDKAIFSSINATTGAKRLFELIKEKVIEHNPEYVGLINRSVDLTNQLDKMILYAIVLDFAVKSHPFELKLFLKTKYNKFEESIDYTENRNIKRIKYTKSPGIVDLTTNQVLVKPEVDLFDSHEIIKETNHTFDLDHIQRLYKNENKQKQHEIQAKSVFSQLETLLIDAHFTINEACDVLQERNMINEESYKKLSHSLSLIGFNIIYQMVNQMKPPADGFDTLKKIKNAFEKYDQMHERLKYMKQQNDRWFNELLSHLFESMTFAVKKISSTSNMDHTLKNLIEQSCCSCIIVYMISTYSDPKIKVLFPDQGEQFHQQTHNNDVDKETIILDVIHPGLKSNTHGVILKERVVVEN